MEVKRYSQLWKVINKRKRIIDKILFDIYCAHEPEGTIAGRERGQGSRFMVAGL